VNLREHARGQFCAVRLPGICNGNAETTVLAHVRLSGISGMGLKSPDLLGAWACSSCHDEIDRRTRELEADFVKLAFYEGILRTQAALIESEVVTW